IFLTRGTLISGGMALLLCLTHTLASRLIWPEANLKVGLLVTLWPALPPVLLLGLAMASLDVYGLFRVGKIDRPWIEKNLDQADFWLRSWTKPVVRVLTLGYVDPHQMVSVEVRKGLLVLNDLLNSTLRWIALQSGLRIAYGLAVWLTWALAG